MSTRAAHDWAKPHNGSRHGTIRHGLRLLVSLLLPLGLIGLAETAVLAAANTSTGSVNAGPPAGALAPSVSAGLLQTCEATTDSTLACGGLNGSAQHSPRSGTFTAVSTEGSYTCGVQSDGTLACWGAPLFGEPDPPSGTFTAVSAATTHACGVKTDGMLECWGDDHFERASPPSGTFIAVSAGVTHTCGLRTDGTLACWGSNGFGQASPPSGTFTAVSAGRIHSCGVKTDGTLACWGDNGKGQASPPSGTFTAVSARTDHTCAVQTDGTLACWGFNRSGQASPPIGTFNTVSAGDIHTCGLKTDGTLACWGNNSDGQASPPSGTFTAVSAGGSRTCGVKTDGTLTCWGDSRAERASPPSGIFTTVSAGGGHTCGMKNDRTLACWGGTTATGQASPPSGTFNAISAGSDHTCGVQTDGTLACWGDNRKGQASPPSGTFTAVSAGTDHTCGLQTDGTLACWGENNSGQASPPSGSFSAVSTGDAHTCGVKTDGTLACWGSNESGQVSPPSATLVALVVPASALGPDWSLAGQPTTTIIAGSQGPLQTYMVMYHNDMSSPSPREASFAVAVTPNAAAADGFVDAIAAPAQAQGGATLTPWQGLGDGRAYKIRSGLPFAEGGLVLDYVFRVGSIGVMVAAIGPATQEQEVDAQARQFAGLQQDRMRAALQYAPATPALALPIPAPAAPPTPPAPPTSPGTVRPAVPPAPNAAVPDQGSPPSGTFTAVSAGGTHTCGVKGDGNLACWGDNRSGQASPPSGIFTSVSAGEAHTCGVTSDGTLACWGFNGYGQANSPSGTFTAVSAGHYHTCGVKTDGTLTCWGGTLATGQRSPPSEAFTTPGADDTGALQMLDPRGLITGLGPAWATIGVGASWTLVGLIFLLGRGGRRRSGVHGESLAWRGLVLGMVSRATVVTGLGMMLVLGLALDWSVGVLVTLLLYAHEVGHVLVAFLRGVRVTRAPTFLPGLGAFVRTTPRTAPWDEVWVSLGGPLFGGAVAVACKVAGARLGIPALGQAGELALLINLFNLAPIRPLDGGRVAALTGPVGSLVALVLAVLMLSADFGPSLTILGQLALTGPGGSLVALVLAVLGVLMLPLSLGPLLTVLVAVSLFLVIRSFRQPVPAVGWSTRLGVVAIYGLSFLTLYLARLLSGEVRWSGLPRPWLLDVAQNLGLAVLGYWLASLWLMRFAWRAERSALARYCLLSLFAWWRYLGRDRRWLPLILTGALLAINTAAGRHLLERMTRSLAQRRDELTGAAAAIGFDVLARRRASPDEARHWIDERVPDIERAGSKALGLLYASLEQLGHAAEAAAWLDRAVTSGQVTPERWPELSNVVAWSALQRGHPEAGLVWAQAAVAGRPEDANFLDTLGQILLAQRKYTEAEAVLRRSLAFQQRTSTRVALARALAAQGQHAAAALEAEEALAEHTGLWPGDAPSAEQVRSWIREWHDTSAATPTSQPAAASATVLRSQ